MSDPDVIADAPLAALDAIDPAAEDLRPRLREEALAFLLTRRSTPSKTLRAPGPSEATLGVILKAGLRVPDYGKLAPWRLIVVDADARDGLAADAARRAEAAGRSAEDVEKTRLTLLDAPTLVIVVSAPIEHWKISADEQFLSAGAVCAALVNAGLAAGFGAQWLSGWAAHDRGFAEETLGLSADERVAGFVHFGTPKSAPPERPRPDLTEKVSRLTAAALPAARSPA